MKRYRIRPTREAGIAAHEHKDGDWVPASVAQALYDELKEALVWYRSEMEICEDDDNEYVASQFRERINDAAEALSLADGETE